MAEYYDRKRDYFWVLMLKREYQMTPERYFKLEEVVPGVPGISDQCSDQAAQAELV